MRKLLLSLTLIIMTACSQQAAEDKVTTAVMKTNHGTMTIELHTAEAPETTKNFIELAKAGKYDGVIFHRVIPDFMIQGGDFENGNGTGGHSYKGPGTSIKDEFGEGLTHTRGALSMANSGPNTGGSQFFIVHAKNGTPHLDGAHAIFGQLTDGFDVLDEIAGVDLKPSSSPFAPPSEPAEDVVIEKITIK